MIGYLNGRRKEGRKEGKISSERRMEWNRAFRRRNKLGGGGGAGTVAAGTADRLVASLQDKGRLS